MELKADLRKKYDLDDVPAIVAQETNNWYTYVKLELSQNRVEELLPEYRENHYVLHLPDVKWRTLNLLKNHSNTVEKLDTMMNTPFVEFQTTGPDHSEVRMTQPLRKSADQLLEDSGTELTRIKAQQAKLYGLARNVLKQLRSGDTQ